MSSTYSTNLALELIGTGDQAGTWGATTNTNLGTLIEQAISGYVTQAITDGADTVITIPNGASGVARNMFIECTGALTAARNLIIPTNKKLYFIYNNTSGGFSVTVKTSGGSGVAVPAGYKIGLVCDGTNVIQQHTYTYNPAFFNPTLGTPASGTLTNCTGLPVSTGISGLGSNVAAFLATPSSANLASAVSDETGSGSLVFATSPTLVTPNLGTPSAATLTNATGLPVSTGISGLGSGVATFLATPSSANLAAAVTGETGSGALVFATSPTLVTPALGTPASGNLSNCVNVSLTTGVTGTLPVANGGTGTTTASGTGSVVLNNGPTLISPALGTPASGNLSNCTFPTLNQNTTGSAGSVTTTNFTIEESGGKLVFKYGATAIGSLDSSGNFIVIGNVTAYGTP